MRDKKKEEAIVAAPDPKAVKKQERVDRITHKVAIVVVFVSAFYFFIKLLFL